MNMQVHVDQTVIIRPEKWNDDHDHIVLPLSHIDNDRNLDVILRYLRIYPPNSAIDPFQLITAALSSALVHYYPFAGKLHRRITDGRLELLCQADDGVAVTSASLDCDISQIIDRIHHNFVDHLAPHLDPDQDLIPPITLQVTKLRCGGFVLGAAVHHALCDGIGATLLFSAMAELARGLARITVDPVWDRVELLGPKTDYSEVGYPINDLLELDKDFIPYTGSGERIIKEFASVKDVWLDHLKQVLHQKSGLKFTTFEALGAFIWRARTKAYEVSEDEKVTFAYSINIRNVVNPPLPAGYWGNGCVPMYVHLTAKELLNQPIWKTAASIKNSKYDVTDKYIRSFIQFQQLHYNDGIIAGRRVSGFTDWRHLGHSNVDFGWGGPVAVVPLSTHLLGSNEPCFFLPGKPGMIKVLAHLEESALLAFSQEMDKLKQLDVYFSSL